MSPLESHLRRAAFVLLATCLVIVVPSFASAQVLDSEGAALFGELLSAAGKDPTSPMAAGALLFFVVYLATRAPLTSRILAGVLTTDARKRAFSLAAALLPGVATVLTGHMSWSKALGTALISWAVSQAIFFLSKKPAAAAPLVALFFLGCIDKATIEKGANGGADALEIAKPCLADKFKKDEADCRGNAACLAVVAEHRKVAKAGYDAFGCLLCVLDATAEGCATDKPCERLAAEVTK